MAPGEKQDQPAGKRAPELLLAVVVGLIAMAIVPAAIVWIATRMVSTPEAAMTVFPEDAFPAQGLNLAEYRRDMESRLHGFGWIDRDKGIARVPIELGMQLVIAHKLPARGEQPSGAKKQ